MIDVLSILSSALACASMLLYVRQLLRGDSIPNPATWSIWLIIGVINAVTYFTVVNGSLLRSLTLIIVTTGILFVTFYSLFRGKFVPLGRIDLASLALAIGVGALWLTTGDAAVSNLLLQSVYVVSFVPTVVDLRRGRIREQPLPWALAVGAYALMIVSVLLSWGEGSWIALAHPVLNGILGNGAIAWLAYRTCSASLPIVRKPRARVMHSRRLRIRKTSNSAKFKPRASGS